MIYQFSLSMKIEPLSGSYSSLFVAASLGDRPKDTEPNSRSTQHLPFLSLLIAGLACKPNEAIQW